MLNNLMIIELLLSPSILPQGLPDSDGVPTGDKLECRTMAGILHADEPHKFDRIMGGRIMGALS